MTKVRLLWFLVRMIILHLRNLSILQREAYLHVIIVGWWDILDQIVVSWNSQELGIRRRLLRRKKMLKKIPRQPTQKFVPICHHCGLSGHIRPKCPYVLVQRSKVKMELPKKDSAGTRPPRKHHAQRKLSRYAPLVHKTLIRYQCGVNSHVRSKAPPPQKKPSRHQGPPPINPIPRYQQ
jgi:hypothetical protein